MQSFPDADFPDERWVAMGLFMLGGDIPPLVFATITNVYPLIWLVTIVLTAVVIRRSGGRGARLRDYGTTDESSPRAQDRRGS